MIERIRPPELFEAPGYAHAAVTREGATVYTAGAVPLDAQGNLVGPGDPVLQTRRVLANLLVALKASGTTLDDLVKTTVYVVADERSTLAEVWRVVSELGFAEAPSTLLGVSLLGYEGQLVEVEAIAVVPAGL